jgi:hypothetical protein
MKLCLRVSRVKKVFFGKKERDSLGIDGLSVLVSHLLAPLLYSFQSPYARTPPSAGLLLRPYRVLVREQAPCQWRSGQARQCVL